jgi:hypothetical protein
MKHFQDFGQETSWKGVICKDNINMNKKMGRVVDYQDSEGKVPVVAFCISGIGPMRVSQRTYLKMYP